MDPARYQRLKQLFAAACALPPAERAAFLERECGDDDRLLAEVEALLREDGAATDSSLDRAVRRSLTEPSAPSMPAQIGRYRVRAVCGVGGMGTVYEAEQDHPARRVAVKVLHATTARSELLHRFRREAEILGRLQHPGIAQIFEAGEFEQDAVTRPFFAMEFVEGEDLVAFARRRALTGEQRVDLFARVCDAVQHAHEHGVVHRDLKPDNILVVEHRATMAAGDAPPGQPKVLDFGVARLADADERMTLATGAGQLVGSLPYMSPEQAAGTPSTVDARTDVYALGVVLFELLAERLPYDVSGKPLDEAVRTIREREPTRLGSVRAALRGDLETIVGRCLEKEPARRYASVAALIDDLRRFRESLPIQARPPSALYQLRKFARRHRVLVVGALGTVLSLAVGLVFAVVFALRAADKEREALREADRANITAADSLVAPDPLAARAVLERVPAARRAWEWRYLDSRLRPTTVTFGEVFPRTGMAALDEGARLLAGRDARRATLWDTQTGAESASYEAPGEVAAWGVSADGGRLAAGLVDGRVFVGARAETIDWQLWRTCEAPPVQLEFSPLDGELAVLTEDALALGSPATEWRTLAWRSPRGTPTLAFSPSGARVALLPFGRATIEVLATVDLAQVARRFDHDGPRALAFSRDGARLVIGNYQRHARLADPETTEGDALLKGHTRPVVAVACGPDGAVATASRDGTVRVWNAAGVCTAVIPVPGVARVAFLSSTRLVAVAGGQLHALQLDDRPRRVLEGHHSYVYELAFSADGARLLTNCPFDPCELIVWEAWTGGRIVTTTGHWKTSALSFDGQGNVVAANGVVRTQRPWFADGARVTAPALGPALYWQQHAKLLRTGTHGASLAEPTSWHVVRLEYGGDGASAAMRIDGERAALERLHGGALEVGDRPRLLVGSLGDDLHGLDGDIGDLVVFAGELADEDAGRVERYLAQRRELPSTPWPDVRDAELLVHLRADERDLELGEDGAVLAWRAHNDASIVLRAHGPGAAHMRFAPAGDGQPARVTGKNYRVTSRWLEAPLPAAAGRARLTVFWSGRHDAEHAAGDSAVFSLHTPPLRGARSLQPDARRRRLSGSQSRSADGHRIARGGTYARNHVYVRDTRTGDLLLEVSPEADVRGFWGVSMHASGALVACGCDDGHVEVWDVDGRRRVARFAAHAGAVYAVAWSPDGARLATGGNDNSIRLWDAATGKPCLELRGHDAYVKSLAWSPDGTMLASASGDGTARLWDSVSAAARHRQALALRALEDEVRGQVEGWLRELDDVHAVGDRIRAQFVDDEPRRMAAFTALARAQRR